MGNSTKLISVTSEKKIHREEKSALEEICKIAGALTGVQLTEKNHPMIISRLQKRINELGLHSFAEYVEYYTANQSSENGRLISLLTTHHTYFFREFIHFEKLLSDVLPVLIPIAKSRPDKKIRIWAAACSRGQEVYSLAMFLDYHLRRINSGVQFEIFGTDIDKESVAIAANGVFLREELKEVPLNLMGTHWARGTGQINNFVKAKSSLRNNLRFDALNLCDLNAGAAPQGKFDLIFCRNVFIYFNREQIQSITRELMNRLEPQGYLFLGISETLAGLNLPLEGAGPSIYRHKQPKKAPTVAIPAPNKTVASPLPEKPSVVRILCVDDSPVILMLLKRIFEEEKGFEVVGTATNGLEAKAQVEKLKPDAVTLDIHMPHQTGIEYLEKNMHSSHPPVIMVTSVSREDASLAGKALLLGAADYVEKPAMSSLGERAEEIRNKVRNAVLVGQTSVRDLSLDQSFQTRPEVTDPASKLRVILFSLSERKSLHRLLGEFKGNQPPTVLVLAGAKEALPGIAEVLKTQIGKSVSLALNATSLNANDVLLSDIEELEPFYNKFCAERSTSILVFGNPSKAVAKRLMVFRNAHLVLQDLGKGEGAASLKELANDVVLPSSFAYLSDAFLAKSSSPLKKAG